MPTVERSFIAIRSVCRCAIGSGTACMRRPRRRAQRRARRSRILPGKADDPGDDPEPPAIQQNARRTSSMRPVAADVCAQDGGFEMNRRARRAVMHSMRRAGGLGPTQRMRLNIDDTPWKEDDRRWFAANPKRAHRLRHRFPGEDDHGAAPPWHVDIDWVCVRQIEPGSRIRRALQWREVDPRFLDRARDLVAICEHSEAIAHALFDLPRRHEPMSMHQLCALLFCYLATADARRQ